MITVATTAVQGEDVLFEASEDNGVTWLKLVCLIKQDFEATRNVNKTNTQCGPLIGKGTLETGAPVEGAVNVAAPAGYASYAKLQEWMKEFTPVLVRQQSPTLTGSDLKNQTAAYMTDLKLSMPIDNIATFTAQFTGFGEWTITP